MDVSLDHVSNLPNKYDYINQIGMNPWSLIFLSVIIVVYYLIFSTLGGSSGDGTYEGGSNFSFGVLEVIIWGLFILLLLLNGLYYFFNLDVAASIKHFFSPQPEVVVGVTSNKPKDGKHNGEDGKHNGEGGKHNGEDGKHNGEGSTDGKYGHDQNGENSIPGDQVFHVPGNELVYDEAKAVCSAYGGRLATYEEVESAYENGGEWCSYGWSDNQMALFPTQKQSWDKLQTIKGHENDCGRPGVNGGYIDNPAVRFGANCVGYKPKMTAADETAMEAGTLYPKTAKDVEFDRRVDYWRKKLPEVVVAPFNKTSWSRI